MKKQYLITTKVVHYKKEPYDVYIGRGSEWGNPYTHLKDRATKAKFIVHKHRDAVAMYGSDLIEKLANEKLKGKSVLREKLLAMRGKTFGCTCIGWYKECHCHVIAEIIEELYFENR